MKFCEYNAKIRQLVNFHNKIGQGAFGVAFTATLKDVAVENINKQAEREVVDNKKIIVVKAVYPLGIFQQQDTPELKRELQARGLDRGRQVIDFFTRLAVHDDNMDSVLGISAWNMDDQNLLRQFLGVNQDHEVDSARNSYKALSKNSNFLKGLTTQYYRHIMDNEATNHKKIVELTAGTDIAQNFPAYYGCYVSHEADFFDRIPDIASGQHAQGELTLPEYGSFAPPSGDDVTLFLLSEYIEGPTLKYSHRDSLEGEINRIVTRMHELGFTHGDIHGGNIIVHETRGPVFIDFSSAQFNDKPDVFEAAIKKDRSDLEELFNLKSPDNY